MSRDPHEHERDPDLSIKAGLLTVVAFLSWPIWLVWVSAHPTADAAVWWSALIPLAITLLVVAEWLDIPSRVSEAFGRGAHDVAHAAHLDRHHHHGPV
jgi:hypothetical protein